MQVQGREVEDNPALFWKSSHRASKGKKQTGLLADSCWSFFCLILTVAVNICQHLCQALPFCPNITNTWARRPHKQQGEQNRSGFKAGSCLALPLLLLAPYILCVRLVQSVGDGHLLRITSHQLTLLASSSSVFHKLCQCTEKPQRERTWTQMSKN